MASLSEEDDYFITRLDLDYNFPDPRLACDEGLLAYGGDLSPNRLLSAYRKGIFPWYSDGDPILWWSPDPRLLLYPEKFHTSRSLARVLRSGTFRVTFDNNFSEVIRHCAAVPRGDQKGTWLTPEMQEAYTDLHYQGFAHSVDVWHDNILVGGVYGIALGKAFFGESMFSLMPNASKVALRALSDVLGARGYDFIDCQVKTDHLMRLGAEMVSRDDFLDALNGALQKPSDLGSWHDFRWEYDDGR